MLEITKFAFKYDPAADRLRIAVIGKDGRCTLLLTRRLAIRWLKALAQWLESGADPALGLEIAHGRALSRLARAAGASPGEPEGKAAGEPVLVSSIKSVQSRQSINIAFYAGNDEAAAEGAFGRVAGHGLLDRLARAMDRAGWSDPVPIPEWCRSASLEKQPMRGKATLH